MVLGRALWTVAGAVGIYGVVLGLLLTPGAQRFALYAHRFNTLFWHDLHDSEQFGFAPNQVSAFTIETPDGERLYAWHILPIDVYTRQEGAIRNENRTQGPLNDFTKTKAFELLTGQEEPPHVVISFHGNAGHIAQGWRADAHRSITMQQNTHVFTIDYRGFGHSSGTPSEAGLITDGVALVDWVMRVCHVPPANIVLLGQSLGTAVSSAVALHFVDGTNPLLPLGVGARLASSSIAFASVILVAPFANLPSLLLTYRIGGTIPLLGPLRPFPAIGRALTSHMVDQWKSADRLAAYYDTLVRGNILSGEHPQISSLQILHALDDRDISYHQTEMICSQIFRNSPQVWGSCVGVSGKSTLVNHVPEHGPRVRLEFLRHGGHNRIITSSSVAAAVLRAFDP